MDKQKIAVVTGGSTGIGLETVIGLARAGCRVIFTGRDQAKGQAAAKRAQAETGNEAIEFVVLDLASQAEIRSVGAELARRLPRIDILVHNAGGIYWQWQPTVDGLESTFAVNHLGPFLLTNVLLGSVEAAGPGVRIVVVSSSVHRQGRLIWDDLQAKKNYQPFGAYSNSKLANVLFAFALARRLAAKGIDVNCLHPGVVRTEFARSATGGMKTVLSIAQNWFGISARQGAATSLYLALDSTLSGRSGAYYIGTRRARVNPIALDEAAQDRLWEISQALTNLPR